MTKHEAINTLQLNRPFAESELQRAVDMAIDALKKQSMVNEILNEAEQYKLALFAVIRNPQLMSCGMPIEEVNMLVVKTMEKVLSKCDFESLKRNYAEAEKALAKMGGKE